MAFDELERTGRIAHRPDVAAQEIGQELEAAAQRNAVAQTAFDGASSSPPSSSSCAEWASRSRAQHETDLTGFARLEPSGDFERGLPIARDERAAAQAEHGVQRPRVLGIRAQVVSTKPKSSSLVHVRLQLARP